LRRKRRDFGQRIEPIFEAAEGLGAAQKQQTARVETIVEQGQQPFLQRGA